MLVDQTPVIIGVGEFTQRSKDLAEVLEPLDLMEAALQQASHDAGADVLPLLDSIDVIQEFSWPYHDAPAQLCERMGLDVARKNYGPVGGETPIQFIHEAALRIFRGESQVAAVVGAEAQYAVSAAARAKQPLPWTPKDPDAKLIRGVDYLHPAAVALEVASPVSVYPLYENAAQAAWGQTPREALAESAEIWARNSEVAEANPYAWRQQKFTPDEVATPADDNRLIAWPYPVRMVANPMVNQGAAVIVASLGVARNLGIPDEHLVYLWCGAAAHEHDDYLYRDGYTQARAQEVVLEKIKNQVGECDVFSDIELYSCFPIVPKMARRTLGLPVSARMTCTGGLSFFGAPLNNYMTHAAASMVRSLRGRGRQMGLLYGQGGYLTKHHAIVISAAPPAKNMLSDNYSVQAEAEARHGAVPPLAMDYSGPASVETYTVIYQRDGSVKHGVVIALSPEQQRILARVPANDSASIDALVDLGKSPIGAAGMITVGDDGLPEWSLTA